MCVTGHPFHMVIRFFSIVVFIVCMLSASPIHAQTSAVKAKELQSMFTEVLDQYQTSLTGAGVIEFDGGVTVEEKDFYYAVTLPHMAVVLNDGSRFEVGMVAINALQGDKADTWKMTVALPTPLVYYGTDGGPAISIDIGSQNFAGIWHNRFRNFVKQKAQYQDVVFSAHTPECGSELPCDVKVKDLKVVYDLVENEEGRWSGPSKFILQGFSTQLDKSGGSFGIDEIKMAGNIKNYSIEDALEYQEKILAMNELYETGSEEDMSTAHVMAVYNMFTDFLTSVWDGFDAKVALRGIKYNGASNIANSPLGSFNLDMLAFGYAMDGFRTPKVDMKYGMSYGGLSFDGMDEMMADVSVTLPTDIAIDIGINDLPFTKFLETGKASFQALMDQPEMAAMQGMQALMSLPQLMSDAGTNVSITDSFFGNDKYRVNMNALLKADMGAVKHLYGDGKVDIRGIETLLAAINKSLSNPSLDEAKKSKLNGLVGMLTMLQMMGQQGTDAQGQPIRTYNFELTKDGQSMLNGSNLENIMGMGGAAPVQQEPPMQEAAPEPVQEQEKDAQ